MKTLLLSSLIVMSVSCAKPTRLEQALCYAGENRAELQKVLDRYRENEKDSLKYQAAVFLIENMPYHYSYIGKKVDSYYQNIDFVLSQNVSSDKILSDLKTMNERLGRPDVQSDIRLMDAQTLINHIDCIFRTKEYPWYREMSFDDFCEYLLPYRVGREPITDWMPVYTEYAKKAADSLYDISESYEDFISRIFYHFGTRIKPTYNFNYRLDLPPRSVINIQYFSCNELAAWGIYTFKALGIPVYWEFIPNWGNRNSGHAWNGIDMGDEYLSFTFLDECAFGEHLNAKTHNKDDKLTKIYRRTFSPQKEALAAQKQDKSLPDFFRNTLMRDVSHVYGNSIDLEMTLNYLPPVKTDIVYLMVFNNKEWVPVHWARIKEGKALFDKTFSDCAYLVSYYHRGKFHAASDPFLLKNDGCIEIKTPDTNSLTNVTVRRKYPFKFKGSYLTRLNGGKFQVANNKDYIDAEDIYVIGDLDIVAYTVIELPKPVSTQYFRYLSREGGHVYIAEVALFDERNQRLAGTVLGTDGSAGNKGHDKYGVFDGNPLTYFDAPIGCGGWAGLDFHETKNIKKLAFLPVNDDNHINEGEIYELFYFDKEWVSLGKRVGDATFRLEYDNVPRNAILHVKNHTKGVEERLFTYENDKQIWW